MGYVFTTGGFHGTADFDPGADTFTLTSAGDSDMFVQKLDAAGNLIWARAMGGTDSDYAASVAVDAQGNVYTTGSFRATADFDSGPDTHTLTVVGYMDMFVHKLSGPPEVTPESMPIAVWPVILTLLGLGALAIRRRR
jgi:hypothetical protein